MNKPIAININFDSLNEHFGFPKNYRDPSFFEVFDRFLKFSNEYDFKYSIYIIGKDLENPEINARVKEWSELGHEIGNHSYSHRMNIGGLNETKLRDEILKSHELIYNCTGKEPKGFICPGWSTSKKVVATLIENNYLYDTSLFPSFIMYPAIAKNAFNHLLRPEKFKEIISRRDYLFPVTKSLTPFFSDKNFKKVSFDSPKDKIVILPLPTLSRYTMSVWHTLLFTFGLETGKKNISKYLDKYDYFYYLTHPADLMDTTDLGDRKHAIERMNIDLKTKTLFFKEVFDLFRNSGRPIVTMERMALNFIEEKNFSKQRLEKTHVERF